MAFDQATRNRLQKFVGDARKLLSDEFTQQLQNTYGLDPVTGAIAELCNLPSLSPSKQQTATLLRDTLGHYLAASHKADPHKDNALVIAALDRIVREQAFTVLNRLAALRMAEARQFVMESISQGYQSKGFQLYQRIAGSSLGETGQAYQHYLFSVFDELSSDLAVLFDRYSSQGRLFPRETVLLELLDLINHAELEILWAEDETVGWIYQYFNSKEERKKMRDESQAPRNSRELAVRNQFFTPRYVVEFLTDNTLGRIWYEMTHGNTALVDSCKYLVRRPNEIFLKPGEQARENDGLETAELSQEELLQQTVYIQHRPMKDPRDIKMLDPACGSMHFGLYAFDLFEKIYTEAWEIEADEGKEIFFNEEGIVPRCALHEAYPDKEAFLADVPRLIIEHNIHGVDIDPRATQIAGLSLWLRAQKFWSDNSITPNLRPQVQRSNIVCAEPMPGETKLLREFASQIQPRVLGQLVEEMFDKMQLAGEAGTLLKIEEEIQAAINEAKSQKDENIVEVQGGLFGGDKWEVREGKRYYNFGDVSEDFWAQAEQLILTQLERYAESSSGDGSGQKRLFAADTAKGFAFIDLCRKRFDVILMNPPFGPGSTLSRNYLTRNYPSSYSDIANAFVDRGMSLAPKGLVGAITTRTCFYISSLERWRVESLNELKSLNLLFDLGYGVLDAVVETAAYVVNLSESNPDILIVDGLESKDKEDVLQKSLTHELLLHVASATSLSKIPSCPLLYWAPQELLNILGEFEFIEPSVASVKRGVATGDNLRMLRLFWEVNPRDIGSRRKWILYAKGGEYSPNYIPTRLVLNWEGQGHEILNFYSDKGKLRSRPQNLDAFGKPGLAYASRTTSGFGSRLLPMDHGFDQTSNPIVTNYFEDAFWLLAYLTTSLPQAFVELAVGGGDTSGSGAAARDYTNGLIGRIPLPNFTDNVKSSLSKIGEKLIECAAVPSRYDETTPIFDLPILLTLRRDKMGEAISEFVDSTYDRSLDVLKLTYEAESIVRDSIGLSAFTRSFLDGFVGPHPLSYSENYTGIVPNRVYTKKCYFANQELEILCHSRKETPMTIDSQELRESSFKQLARSSSYQLLSYFVGMYFNRWGRVSNEDREFNLEFLVSGKLNKQFFYASDINVSVVDVFELANYVEQRFEQYFSSAYLQEVLIEIGSVSVAEYLSDANGFFSDHLAQCTVYSRAAPIYWMIQSAKGTYSYWLYYHNLDEESLFLCMNNHVDPSLKLLSDEIARFKLNESNSDAKGSEVEKLVARQNELVDFRDELLRLSRTWNPNVDDGVEINAAPLYRLFQHKSWRNRLKKTWIELVDGGNDWARIAYTMWPERVLKKCHQDRSFAIAHGVEAEMWEELELPVGKSKRTKPVLQPKEMSEAELDGYIKNKIAQG